MGPCVRRDDVGALTVGAEKSFKLRKIYFLKPAPKPPVARPNDDAVNQATGQRRCCPSSPAIPAGHLNPSGDDSMSKRIALFSAAAFAALALTAAVVAPVSAQDKMMKSELSGEKTVMVGGAAMFPSKNIIQNAVNSKDHTTLVAAVKAAGLVATLKSKGPFTVFAPTNAAFERLPAGTVDTLLKPENKGMLTQVLTYHVLSGRYDSKALASLIKKGHGKAQLKTVSGDILTAMMSGGNLVLRDQKGSTSTVTI